MRNVSAESAATATSTVLITGGYGGIGLHASRELHNVAPDSIVVIAGRNASAAQAACIAIGPRARPMVADFSSLKEVDRLATKIISDIGRGQLPPLRAIVCNAGLQSALRHTELSADGIELTFAVNHLAHFLLVTRILSSMRGPGARVVVVSSGTHDPKAIEGRFNPPRYENALSLATLSADEHRSMSSIQRYATSKLCNLLFAYELARRKNHFAPGLTLDVLAFDPGAVPGTGLLRHLSPFARAVITWPPMLRLFGVRTATPMLAGRQLARLATDLSFTGLGVAYFSGDRISRSSAESYNERLATDLWSTSEQLVARLLSEPYNPAGKQPKQ